MMGSVPAIVEDKNAKKLVSTPDPEGGIVSGRLKREE